MEVDAAGWKHPRPPADPRLVCLAIGFIYLSFVQTFFVKPDSSVSAQAYTTIAAIAVAGLVIAGSALLLRAAFCRSQFSSWGWEIGSCMCFAGQSIIQFVALVGVNSEWYGTATFVWTIFWGAGNVWRAWILTKRVML